MFGPKYDILGIERYYLYISINTGMFQNHCRNTGKWSDENLNCGQNNPSNI